MKYGLKGDRSYAKEPWKQAVEHELLSLKFQVASLKDQLGGEESFAKESWQHAVEQKLNSVKFEVASLKEQLSNCMRHVQLLGEIKSPEPSPFTPVKGFEKTTNPFQKNEVNNVKKIDFTFQVSADIQNDNVISLEPKVESFTSMSHHTKSTTNGTYGTQYKPTVAVEGHPGRFGSNYMNYQSITCMHSYFDKSFEELRWEDYNVQHTRLRTSNQVKFRGPKWSNQKPLRRFSYSRKDKSSHGPCGGGWFFNEPKFPPPLNQQVNNNTLNSNPFTFNTDHKKNTCSNLFQNVKFNPWIPFGSSTSVDKSPGLPELWNIVVAKLEKMEGQMASVNNQLLTLGSQVTRMESRSLLPRPCMPTVMRPTVPLKFQVTESPKEAPTKSEQATNTEQKIDDAVNGSPSPIHRSSDKNNTLNVATNTLPLTTSPSLPIIETSSNLLSCSSPKPTDTPQESKFRFSSPMFLNTTGDESNASTNTHLCSTDEDKIESQITEKKNDSLNQQNFDKTDSTIGSAGTNTSDVSVDDKVLEQTEENISDSEKDFEIVEKEELAQQISMEGKNVSEFSSDRTPVFNDITEYMEIKLGQKKGEVYEFGFEVKADGVNASTSTGENVSLNIDDSFRDFVGNLIDKIKLKHSSPSMIPEKGSKVDGSSSNNPDSPSKLVVDHPKSCVEITCEDEEELL